MADSLDASTESGYFYFTICICFIGFVGTVISTSFFLHFSQKIKDDSDRRREPTQSKPRVSYPVQSHHHQHRRRQQQPPQQQQHHRSPSPPAVAVSHPHHNMYHNVLNHHYTNPLFASALHQIKDSKPRYINAYALTPHNFTFHSQNQKIQHRHPHPHHQQQHHHSSSFVAHAAAHVHPPPPPAMVMYYPHPHAPTTSTGKPQDPHPRASGGPGRDKRCKPKGLCNIALPAQSTMNLRDTARLLDSSHTHTPTPMSTQHADGAISTGTQIILDWDDTLFPTAYTVLNLEKGVHSSDALSAREWQQLQELMNSVLHIVSLFVHLFGEKNVAIVTNAKKDWFNESCKIYRSLYMQVHDLLVHTHHIEVISAFDSYARQKSSAFMDVLSDKQHIHQVICIGDSNEEYEAIDNVCTVLRTINRRSISYYRFKLVEAPSLDSLIQQLHSIKKFDYKAIAKLRCDQSYQFK